MASLISQILFPSSQSWFGLTKFLNSKSRTYLHRSTMPEMFIGLIQFRLDIARRDWRLPSWPITSREFVA